jgi:hypothetical protein
MHGYAVDRVKAMRLSLGREEIISFSVFLIMGAGWKMEFHASYSFLL